MIKEGKKRQVRRMLKAVGCYVLYLERISIGQLKLDENLPVGGYRKLSLQETEMVFKCNSSKVLNRYVNDRTERQKRW